MYSTESARETSGTSAWARGDFRTWLHTRLHTHLPGEYALLGQCVSRGLVGQELSMR